jgi:hypothetical protein
MSTTPTRPEDAKEAAAVIAALLEHDETTPRGRPRLSREGVAFLSGALWVLEGMAEGWGSRPKPAVARPK